MHKTFHARKSLLLILALFIAGIAVLFPTFFHGYITIAHATGSINSISPNNGGAGTTVTLQGTGFGATLKGKITLGGNVVSNFYTDASGNFTQTFTVPTWASIGATTITATNKSTSASIAFTINTATTQPNRVNPVCVSSHLNRTSLSNSDIDTQLTLMQQAGIGWTRFDFFRSKAETSLGVYDWSFYDNIMNRATAKGINVIAMLDQWGVPTWESYYQSFMYPDNATGYSGFASAIATHYKGQIKLYELGNEENSKTFWPPVATVSAYTQLLIGGYNAIKAADPTAKVISGGLAQQGTTIVDPVLYLEQMYANGAKGHFDYFGMHPYSQPHTPDFFSQVSSTASFNIVSRLKTLMEREGERNKQIMITELGWPTYSGSGGVTEANQASYISRVYTKIMHEDYQYIPIACVYDFVNDGTDTNLDQDNFGIVNTDYSVKASYTSMQNAASDFSSNFTAISP